MQKQPSSAPPLPPLMASSPSQLPSVMAVPHPTHPDAVTAAAAAAAVSSKRDGLQLYQGLFRIPVPIDSQPVTKFQTLNCHSQTTAGLRRAASAAAATLGTKEEVNAERRAASDREYMRMAQDGAPPDAKCAPAVLTLSRSWQLIAWLFL